MKEWDLERESKPNILSKLYGRGKTFDAFSSLIVAMMSVFCYIFITGMVSLSFKLVVKMTNAGADEGKIETLTQRYSGLFGIVGNIVALSAAVLVIYLFGMKVTRALRFDKPPALWSVAPAFILGLALNFLCDTAIGLIPFPQSMIDRYNEVYSFLGSGSKVAEFVAIALVGPVVEEIVFRGMAYGSMRSRMPKALAVIISSALFGAAHANMISFIFTFMLGVFLAIAFEFSDSLFIPVIIHVEFNASSYIVSYVLEKTGTETHILICIISAVASAAALFLTILPYVKRRKKEAIKLQENNTEIINGDKNI
ncbi:MAG: CPBP family intramembrane metalloprotease [Clostridia bacterium]|nr:CPBP family intramembrane metalloprotease [Clostridia bacterium]